MDPVTVLIVDDLEDFRDLVRRAARSDGRVTIVAEAGEGVEGIRLAGAMQPDVVILDLHMPLMDGFEAIAGIRSLAPRTKILAWSSFDRDFGEDAVTMGADGHMSKTDGVRKLLDTVVAFAHIPVDQKSELVPGGEWLVPYLVHSVGGENSREIAV